MRCPQCGNDTQQGAAFCSRCGARMFAPKPDAVREYAIAVFRPSLWHYFNSFLLGAASIVIGAGILNRNYDQWRFGFLAIGFGILMIFAAMILARQVRWNLTSDRLIERRGFLATRKREMELADIRSVEVSRRVAQRLLGVGDVTIASAASADYAIHLTDVTDPDNAAETIRKARLRRLA
ncbi:MAG TPA: PH domain-containing protein [Candidatus Binataceae bacterium]|nr:PH domain-containing protein [Candidatus Binataceae bacterium]